MKKVTVSRNDQYYECFPDVVALPGNRLICVYRESDGHNVFEYCNLVYRTSDDAGQTWSDRHVLRAERKDETTELCVKWNCPRIQRLSDGRLLIICDTFPSPRSRGEDFTRFPLVFWWSEDDGETWSAPQEMPIYGAMPGRVVELPSGAWLLTAQIRAYIQGGAERGNLTQIAYRSEDSGRSWEAYSIVGQAAEYELCEGSAMLLPNGDLVCYMREDSRKGIAALKAFSYDEGRTWEGLYRTPMDGCHRPVAGVLPSGKVLITYRYQQGGMVGVPPIGPVGWNRLSDDARRQVNSYWSRNVFAYLETVESAAASELPKQGGVILPIDHDPSPIADGGYTGWATIDDGRIFCVNYIMDDAALCQIRGYWFHERDF